MKDIADTLKELALQCDVLDSLSEHIYDNLNMYAEDSLNFEIFKKKIDTNVILDVLTNRNRRLRQRNNFSFFKDLTL